MNRKIKKSILRQFLKRFANGEQHLLIGIDGRFVEFDKDYYWQEKSVYNRIQSLLESRRNKFVSYCKDKRLDANLYLDDFNSNELFVVVDKLVPVQRAYNAIKNRKQEYFNRVGMGILAVEDGSIDTDTLEDEGLSPGKILIYRQGSTPPQQLSVENHYYYEDLSNEEDRLLSEFNLWLAPERLEYDFAAVIKRVDKSSV